MEIAGHRIMHDLRVGLYTHIQAMSLRFFTRNPVARLVNTTTANNQESPRVAVGCADRWIVVWNDRSQSTSEQVIDAARARRFHADGRPVDATDWPVVPAMAQETSLPAVTATPSGFAIVYEIQRDGIDLELRFVDDDACP